MNRPTTPTSKSRYVPRRSRTGSMHGDGLSTAASRGTWTGPPVSTAAAPPTAYPTSPFTGLFTAPHLSPYTIPPPPWTLTPQPTGPPSPPLETRPLPLSGSSGTSGTSAPSDITGWLRARGDTTTSAFQPLPAPPTVLPEAPPLISLPQATTSKPLYGVGAEDDFEEDNVLLAPVTGLPSRTEPTPQPGPSWLDLPDLLDDTKTVDTSVFPKTENLARLVDQFRQRKAETSAAAVGGSHPPVSRPFRTSSAASEGQPAAPPYGPRIATPLPFPLSVPEPVPHVLELEELIAQTLKPDLALPPHPLAQATVAAIAAEGLQTEDAKTSKTPSPPPPAPTVLFEPERVPDLEPELPMPPLTAEQVLLPVERLRPSRPASPAVLVAAPILPPQPLLTASKDGAVSERSPWDGTCRWACDVVAGLANQPIVLLETPFRLPHDDFPVRVLSWTFEWGFSPLDVLTCVPVARDGLGFGHDVLTIRLYQPDPGSNVAVVRADWQGHLETIRLWANTEEYTCSLGFGQLSLELESDLMQPGQLSIRVVLKPPALPPVHLHAECAPDTACRIRWRLR